MVGKSFGVLPILQRGAVMQRKATSNTRAANAAERAHIKWVKERFENAYYEGDAYPEVYDEERGEWVGDTSKKAFTWSPKYEIKFVGGRKMEFLEAYSNFRILIS